MSIEPMPCGAEPEIPVQHWCAHLPGDRVIPTSSRAEAHKIADEVNNALRAHAAASRYGAAPTGHACAWPWDTASWLEDAVDHTTWRGGEL